MNVVKRVAKNSSVTIAAKGICLVSALFTLGMVARYLTPDAFGKYIFVMAFVAVFEVFTDMGYNSTLVREIARSKDRLPILVGTATLVKALVGLLTFILIVICVNVLGFAIELSNEVVNAIYILGFGVCADFFVDVTISTARAHERMEYEGLIIAFNSVVTMLFIGVVVVLKLGFLHLFWVRLYALLLTLVLSWVVYRRRFHTSRLSKDKGIRDYLTREALPLGMGQVVERFYTRTNFFLIRIIQSVTEVGFYGGAYRIVEQFSLLGGSVVTAVFPVFSVLSKSSRESLAVAHEMTLKLLAVMSLPAVVVIICLSREITGIVFGANLLEVAEPLRVLAFAIFFTFSNLLFKFTLSAMDKQRLYRRNVLVSFAGNLFLALILIPIFGYMGACFAALGSSGLLFVLGHLSLMKYLPEVSLAAVLVKPAVASLTMGLVMFFLEDSNIFLVMSCGAIIYLVVLVALRTFTSDEIMMLKKKAVTIQDDCSEEGIEHA